MSTHSVIRLGVLCPGVSGLSLDCVLKLKDIWFQESLGVVVTSRDSISLDGLLLHLHCLQIALQEVSVRKIPGCHVYKQASADRYGKG